MKATVLAIIMLVTLLFSACGGAEPVTTTGNLPQTTEERIRAIIRNELGNSNRDIAKVESINIVPASAGAYNVAIKFSIDDNLTEGFIKGGAKSDVFDVMEALFTKFNIETINMTGTFSMVDPYGNATESDVLECTLFDSTAIKINWTNMYSDQLFRILDYLWWHPAFAVIQD